VQTRDTVARAFVQVATVVQQQLEDVEVTSVARIVHRCELVFLLRIRQLLLIFLYLLTFVLLEMVELLLAIFTVDRIVALLFVLLILLSVQELLLVDSYHDFVCLVLKQELDHLVVVPQDSIMNRNHTFRVFCILRVLLKILMSQAILMLVQQIL